MNFIKNSFSYNLGFAGTVVALLVLVLAFRRAIFPSHWELLPHLFEWNMYVSYMESEQKEPLQSSIYFITDKSTLILVDRAFLKQRLPRNQLVQGDAWRPHRKAVLAFFCKYKNEIEKEYGKAPSAVVIRYIINDSRNVEYKYEIYCTPV